MYRLEFLAVLIVFSVSGSLFAQDKFEKESRITPKEVPSQALLFIDSLKINTKVKWYKEKGLQRNSIEAKFKLNKVRYSIEFDTLGIIEDVEIEINSEQLKPDLKDCFKAQLKQDCSKHKIVKVQRQFTGSERDLFVLMKTGNAGEQLKTKYEIIVRCKHQNKVDLFEYLFNSECQLNSKSKIIFKNSSHLEY